MQNSVGESSVRSVDLVLPCLPVSWEWVSAGDGTYMRDPQEETKLAEQTSRCQL